MTNEFEIYADKAVITSCAPSQLKVKFETDDPWDIARQLANHEHGESACASMYEELKNPEFFVGHMNENKVLELKAIIDGVVASWESE